MNCLIFIDTKCYNTHQVNVLLAIELNLQTNLGKVHQQILDLLSDQKWHSKDEIYDLTKQTYYDRRIRELRDEEGWKIKYERRGNVHGYRLASLQKGIGKPRHYISSKKRKRIIIRDKNICQLCGEKFSDSELQIDHKIPLIKGGSKKDNNLQALCVDCNVKKRMVCKRCKKSSCDNCVLAHPILVKNQIILELPPKVYEKLKEISDKTCKSIQDIIIEKLG